MGRRTRNRATASAAPPAAAARAQARPRGARAGASAFPLIEACVLLAIVLIVAGLLAGGGLRTGLLAGGIALASLSGLERPIREHAGGLRPHSALLAGAAAVLVAVPLFFLTALPQIALLALGAAVYTVGFLALRRTFPAPARRRAGPRA
jgi:hypothetical protein